MPLRHPSHHCSGSGSISSHIIRPLQHLTAHPNHFYPSVNLRHLHRLYSDSHTWLTARGQTRLSDVQERHGTTCLRTVLTSGVRMREMTLVPGGARGPITQPENTARSFREANLPVFNYVEKQLDMRLECTVRRNSSAATNVRCLPRVSCF